MTASDNISRALRAIGLSEFVTIVESRKSSVIAIPDDALELELIYRDWHRDGVIHPSHVGALKSYREPGAVMPAMQICFLADYTVEIDLDLASPWGGDVASFVVHAGEVIWHTVTGRGSNQRRMARALDRRFGKEKA